MYPKELPHANGQATYSIDGGPSTTFTIPGGGDGSIYNRKIFEVNGLSKEAHTIVITYTSDPGSTPLVISQFYIEGGTNLRATASGGGASGGGSSGGSSTSTTATTNPNGSTVSVADPASSTATRAGSSSGPTVPSLLPGDNATPSDVAGAANGDKSGGSSGGTSNFTGSNEGSSSSTTAPVGAIIGAVIGAIAVLCLLFLLMWYRRRRRIRLREDTMDQGPFTMTREEHGALPPTMTTPVYANYAAPPMQPANTYNYEFPVHNEGFVGRPVSAQPPVQHPAARSKRGPQFTSPYISNQSPYDDDVTTLSTAHLVPAHHHHTQGSIDQSVSAYSGYTNSSVSSHPSRAVFHEDSGVRLPVAETEPVVEYPPMYSAR